MRSLRRLKKHAVEVAALRGHRMQRFNNYDTEHAEAVCAACGAEVFVNARPLPNEIDISGEAVAVGCPGVRCD